MSIPYYPGSLYTPNLGLALYSVDSIIADNFVLLDEFAGGGSSINVNGTLVTSPNLSSTLPVAPAGKTLVTFQFDINGNISAYFTPTAGGVTSVFGRTGAVTAQSGDYSYAQISGTPQLPITKNAVASNWLNSYDSTTGLFTVSQPAASDLSNGTTGTGAVVLASAISGFGSGTVTSFSAGNLSPLFTTSVATASSTPALSFALSNAAQNSVFAGPASGGTGAPTFRALVASDMPTSPFTVGATIWWAISIEPPINPTANAGNITGNNVIKCWRFVVPGPQPMTVSGLAIDISTAVNNSTVVDVGLYDSTGAGILNSNGSGFGGAGLSGNTTGIKTASFSKVTLNPGVYYLAWTGKSAGAVTSVGYILLTGSNQSVVPQMSNSLGAAVYFTSSDTATNGILPSSITLTHLTAGNGGFDPPATAFLS